MLLGFRVYSLVCVCVFSSLGLLGDFECFEIRVLFGGFIFGFEWLLTL